MRDFECHITVEATKEQRFALERAGGSFGWKTSFIEGDPDLGKGTRFFFTKHYDNLEEAYGGTEKFAELLTRYDVKIARKKVEEVLLDTRANNWESP